MRRLLMAIMLALGLAAAPGGAQQLPAGDQEVLAQGAGGLLTADAAEAYTEALEFTLAELGHPTRFGPEERAQIAYSLASQFPYLPLETQYDLAQARAIWGQYRMAWPTLDHQAKVGFAYSVLAIAYGEQQAAQALGLQQGGARGGSGGYDVPLSGDALNAQSCWAAAGCESYDSQGGFTYESYD